MKIRNFFCFILLFILMTSLTLLHGILPWRTYDLTAEKYSGWSGVLRVWVYEGWSPGISTWLNRCASSFEKSREGVYVQIQSADISAISSICENGVIPPDIIIFPSGTIDAPEHLVPIYLSEEVRPSLKNTGTYAGIPYACPIAIGGYAWAYNREFISSVPATWEESDASISVSNETDANHWPAAVLFLCSEMNKFDNRHNIEPRSLDLDLGLAPDDEEYSESIEDPSPISEIVYCQLPEDLIFSDDAFSDFLSGRISVTPVTQQQVKRLESLSDQGKGPDWKIQTTGSMSYTDQIMYASLVDRRENSEKQSLCTSFIYHLLSEDCQSEIFRAGAFSVTSAFSGYDNHDPMRIMEEALRDRPLYAEPAFNRKNNSSLELIVRKFYENGGYSRELDSEIRSLLF